MTPNELREEQYKIIAKAFADAMADARGVGIGDLTRAIERQDAEAVLQLLGLDRSLLAPVEEAIKGAYISGGQFTSDAIGVVKVEGVGNIVTRFDLTSPAAIQWLTTESSKQIVEIVAEQRALVRAFLADGTAQGINPVQQALDIVGRVDPVTGRMTGGILGLTEQQGEWVKNARDELSSLNANYFTRELRDKRFDKTVRTAIDNKKPLTQKQIAAIIARLEDRTLKYRGNTIARTESLNALRAGQHEALQQLVRSGKASAGEIIKEWDSSGPDGRTRVDHLALEGVKVAFDQAFTFADGTRARYPGDTALGASAKETIQCRCVLNYRIDFIAQAARKFKGL